MSYRRTFNPSSTEEASSKKKKRKKKGREEIQTFFPLYWSPATLWQRWCEADSRPKSLFAEQEIDVCCQRRWDLPIFASVPAYWPWACPIRWLFFFSFSTRFNHGRGKKMDDTAHIGTYREGVERDKQSTRVDFLFPRQATSFHQRRFSVTFFNSPSNDQDTSVSLLRLN